MFNLFRKKSGLTLDEPALTLTKDAAQCRKALQDAMIVPQETEDGTLIFPGRAFGAPFAMEIRIHIQGSKVTFVEFYRQEEMDAQQSYAEMSAILRSFFGNTIFTSASVTKALPSEQWYRPGMTVSHFLLEQKGPEEYLHIIIK